MKIGNFISTVYIINLILILFGCSKSNTNHNNNIGNSVFGNSFTYTVTDTSGVKRTFSDTTMLLINNVNGDTTYLINGVEEGGTAAYILQWNTTAGNSIKFFFNDIRSSGLTEVNQLILYLPYYQNNITINNGIGNSQFIMLLNNNPSTEYVYLLNDGYFEPDFINIDIDKADIVTNITDSSGGYISGSFNISAITHSTKQILVTGSFNHVSGNIHN